jgi:hypothetical protein
LIVRSGRALYGMNLDFQYARALSNWGFMSFAAGLSGRVAVLAVRA